VAGSAVWIGVAAAGRHGPAVDRPTRGELPELRPPTGEREGEEDDGCCCCYSAHSYLGAGAMRLHVRMAGGLAPSPHSVRLPCLNGGAAHFGPAAGRC